MNRTTIAAVVAAMALGAAPCVQAQGGLTSPLRNTPAERFNEEDNRMLVAAARKALEEAPENQPVDWANPATNHRGDATVTKSFESQGRACKELRLRNEADGRRGESRVNACQVDGKWRLVGSSQVK